MLAIYMGNLEMAEELINAGADVNVAGNDGRTALMGLGPKYSKNKDLQTRAVKLLLAHGARIDQRDNNGFTPVLALAHTARFFAVETLLDNGANISDKPEKPNRSLEEGEYPLFKLLCLGGQDRELAKILRNHGVQVLDDVAAKQASKRTLLHYAVDNEQFESVQVLLDAGVDINPLYKQAPTVGWKQREPRTPLDMLLNTWSLRIGRVREKLPKLGMCLSD